MIKKIEELLAILDQEKQCYRSMQAVLEDEAASLGLTDRERFDQIQGKKEALVEAIKQLEEKRRQLVDRLTQTCTDRQDAITVRQLAAFFDPPYKGKLISSANELRSLMRGVQNKNGENQSLVRQYLKLINGSLKMLTNIFDGSPVYCKSGEQPSASARSTGAGRVIRGTV
jgi:flagellar biosynthesis/type III secretory pathway chaperone